MFDGVGHVIDCDTHEAFGDGLGSQLVFCLLRYLFRKSVKFSRHMCGI